MKIGFDVDGVLADFSTSYQEALKFITGRDLFHEGDAEDAPCWDWDKFRGYTSEERSAVWNAIKADETWWMNHPTLHENVTALLSVLKELERKHEVYYITSRVGDRAKRQTEIWLFDRLVYPMRAPGVYPTVCIATHRTKGHFAKGLSLDCYIDDNYDNVHDVVEMSPLTRVYLRTRRYNEQKLVSIPGSADTAPFMLLEDYPTVATAVTRVKTLGDMLDKEIALGNL